MRDKEKKPAGEKKPAVYDIEAYRKKKARDKRIRRLIHLLIILALLALLAGGYYLYRSYQERYESSGSAASQGSLSGLEDGFPIALDAVEPKDLLPLEGGISLLTSDEVSIIDSQGNIAFQAVHGFTNPVFKAGGKYLLTYDRGGYGYRLDTGKGSAVSGRALKTVLTGGCAENGFFGLVTSESHYAGCLTVYNRTGEELLKWYSYDEIVDIAFSADGSLAAAACLSFDPEGILTCTVQLLDVSAGEELSRTAFQEVLPLGISFKKSGQIHLVCDNGLKIISADLKNVSGKAYTQPIRGFAFTGDATVLVTADTGEVSSTVIQVEDGGGVNQTVVSGGVQALAASGKSFCLLTDSEIRGYDNSMTVLFSEKVSDEVFQTAWDGSKVYLLSSNTLDGIPAAGPAEEEGSGIDD